MNGELNHKSLSIRNIWRKANVNNLSESACSRDIRLVNRDMRELVSSKTIRRNMLQSVRCLFVDRRKALSTEDNENNAAWIETCLFVDRRKALSTIKTDKCDHPALLCLFVDRRKALSTNSMLRLRKPIRRVCSSIAERR